MTIKGQINVCLHNLNVLHDMVAARRSEDFDLDWQLDQIEHAKVLVWKIAGVDTDENTKQADADESADLSEV